MLVDILNEQQILDHNVTLIVINNSYSEDLLAKVDSRVTKILLNRPPSSLNPLVVVRLNRLIKRINPDAIHLHHEHIAHILFLKSPIFLTVHALDLSLSTPNKKISTVFAISNAVKEDIEQRYPNKYHLKTVLNGIRTDNISRKEIYVLPNHIMHIVQVANLNPDTKGQDLLIDALSLLKERGFRSLVVVFIGGGQSIFQLKERSKEKGIISQVNFWGIKNRDYIYSHLKDFDLMCHPARREGFGLAVAEGIAAGLPVLVPDADGPYEIIKHGELGYTFKKGDVESLADALQDIYEHYQERAARVVSAAYEHVKANYSIRHMVEQYIEEYKLH